MARAAQGQDAVVHLAAKVNVTGAWADYEHANIDGTASVVAACRDAGVRRLVHISSPSVAHAGSALVGAGAGPADPRRARGHYARSKAVAERLALRADGPDLAVVAVRPHLVWGPGDTQLVARLVDRARAGRLPVIGSGAALIDSTYVDNAVDAVVAAVDRCERAAGQALVVSNGEPRPVAELIAGICRAAGAPAPHVRVPYAVARAAGAAVDAVWAARLAAARRRRAGRPAADPVPGRAAGHRALVRPAAHPRGAGLDPAGEPRRRAGRARPGVRRPAARFPARLSAAPPGGARPDGASYRLRARPVADSRPG